MTTRLGLHHVALKTSDWDATMRFYREALGFAPGLGWGAAPDRIAMLDAGDGSCVEVFEDPAFTPTADGTLRPGGVLPHLCLRTDEVDALYARAVAAGARTVLAPLDVTLDTTTGHGAVQVRVSFFEGPSGELIELLRLPA